MFPHIFFINQMQPVDYTTSNKCSQQPPRRLHIIRSILLYRMHFFRRSLRWNTYNSSYFLLLYVFFFPKRLMTTYNNSFFLLLYVPAPEITAKNTYNTLIFSQLYVYHPFRLVCCSLSCHIISACMLQRLLPYHFCFSFPVCILPIPVCMPLGLHRRHS